MHAEASGTLADAGPAPAVCIEAEAAALDPGAWAGVLEAIELATEQKPDFFPDATVVSLPDLTEPWDAADTPTVRIGIWATAADAPDSAGDRQEGLAATDCLADGASWTTTISGEMLQAGAERILAGARLPDDSGSPPIREDAEAAIAVELDPADGRVRTTLQFNVPVGPLRLGGTCWIDDDLDTDGASRHRGHTCLERHGRGPVHGVRVPEVRSLHDRAAARASRLSRSSPWRSRWTAARLPASSPRRPPSATRAS